MSQNCDKLQVQQETNCNSSKASQYRQQCASKLVQLTLPSEIYKKTHTQTPLSSLGGFSLMPLISIKHFMQIGDSRPFLPSPLNFLGSTPPIVFALRSTENSGLNRLITVYSFHLRTDLRQILMM